MLYINHREFAIKICDKGEMTMKAKLCAAAALAMAVVMGTSSAAFAGTSRYFIDVNSDGYGWASDAVDYLVSKSIVSGVGDNKYAPELPIERGDFVLLLSNSFGFGEFSPYMFGFSDVPDDSYYHTAIINAKGAGVITDNYSFYPELPITRGTAMLMLYKTLDINGYVKDATTDLSMYSDADSIKDINSQIAIATLTKMGIVSGNGGKILYNDTMTRAEMAMVFYKAVSYAEANPVTKVSAASVKENTKPADTEDENAEETESTVVSGENTKRTIVIDGSEVSGIENTEIKAEESGQNAVEVTAKSGAKITKSALHATGPRTSAVYAKGSGEVQITDSTLYNSGSDSAAVKGDDKSSVTISGGLAQASSKGSKIVRTSGSATIDGTKIGVSDGSVAYAVDNGDIKIENAEITAEKVNNGLFCAERVDDENSEAKITVRNTSIDGDRKTTLFYADKGDLKARLENCAVNKVAYLVNSRANAKNDKNTIEIDLINQVLEADIICESNTRLIINLKEGSRLKASINEQNLADYVEVNVEEGSELEFTTNSYIDVLKFNDAIDIVENGYTIYYDKDNMKNDWLFEDDYQLAHGGLLSPE